jgi:retron-type reverse transcriptase
MTKPNLNQCLKDISGDLDFARAFRRVKYDSRYDFLRFPVEFILFEHYFEENIKHLRESIQQENYFVKDLRKIWVPKRGYFLRPGSLPHLEDRVLFQAVIDNIAASLEELLPPFDQQVVFSSRLSQDPDSKCMFRNLRSLWIQFQSKAASFCEDSTVNHVLQADIASYFENIDLRLLADTLSSSGISPIYIEVIQQILSKWANGRTRGLPQMLAPCTLLGNVYLSQIDKNMVLRGYKYIRYVDDMRIFVPLDIALRKALLDLTNELKYCYLDVQASKTRFDSAENHREELTLLDRHLTETGIEIDPEADSSYFDEFEEDDEQLPSTPIPEEKLMVFFEELLNNPQYDDRHLRFCINHLRRSKNPIAIDLVISKLQSMPQESATFAQYLSRLSPNYIEDRHIEAIISFLESDYNIYDWQMMWLLNTIARLGSRIKPYLQRLFQIEKLRTHYINRAFFSYIMCAHGDIPTKRFFMALYSQEQSKEVKMAILCGLFDLEKKERNRFYGLAKGDREISQLVDLLKNKNVRFYV